MAGLSKTQDIAWNPSIGPIPQLIGANCPMSSGLKKKPKKPKSNMPLDRRNLVVLMVLLGVGDNWDLDQ